MTLEHLLNDAVRLSHRLDCLLSFIGKTCFVSLVREIDSLIQFGSQPQLGIVPIFKNRVEAYVEAHYDVGSTSGYVLPHSVSMSQIELHQGAAGLKVLNIDPKLLVAELWVCFFSVAFSHVAVICVSISLRAAIAEAKAGLFSALKAHDVLNVIGGKVHLIQAFLIERSRVRAIRQVFSCEVCTAENLTAMILDFSNR